MKKTLVFLLAFTMCMSTFVRAEEPSDWAGAEVAEAIELGIVPEDIRCDYKSCATREEFAMVSVLFVARHFDMEVEDMMDSYISTHVDSYGEPLTFRENVFTDIDDSPYKYYIECANNLGIVNGRGDDTFDPKASITRQEAATMLLRAYFCYGGGVKLGPKSAAVDNFADKDSIASFADTPVRYMYQWDVMKGVSDTHYEPLATYTREQCYVTFVRLWKVFSYLPFEA